MIVVGVVLVAVAVAVVLARRTPSAGAGDGATAIEPTAPDPDQDPDQVLVVPTDRPGEVYLFGAPAELDRYGTELAAAPPQLARYAATLRAGVDAVQSTMEMSGRLVLVDEKTAAALKAGTMMRTKGGEILALSLRSDKKIATVARLKPVGGLAAAASMMNALSAMAMQAQLDRIERQLSEIWDGIDAVNRELLREWHAQGLGARDVLMEVYGTATRTGELTASNWAQIAPIGHVVRTQIHGDRDRLQAAIADLEVLSTAPDVKHRLKELDARVDAVRNTHAALYDSTRTWAQFSALRLWHFTVAGDPSLEAYREELERFMLASREDLEALRSRTSTALQRLPEHRWTSFARHPLAARRLPDASKGRLALLDAVAWQPLELEPPDAADLVEDVDGLGDDEADHQQ